MNKPLHGLSNSSTLLQFRIDKTYYEEKKVIVNTTFT